MQAWIAVPVHPVQGWYLKEQLYRGEAVHGLRQILARVGEVINTGRPR